MTKLTDLCDIQYGYAFDSGAFTDDDTYPQLVRIRDVKRGYSETYYCGEYPEEYVLSAGDLLVGMDGEFNIARWKVDGALLNQRVCKIVTKDNVDEEFLRFALSKALKTIEDRTSFATVKHLSAKELNKLEIPVPSYNEQKKIAELLHRLEGIIESRHRELDSLDELIKARFVEMFGRPALNDKRWKECSLAEVCNKITDGEHKNPEFVEEGVPMVMANNVQDYGVNFVGCRCISEEDYKKFSKKCKPEKGDVLLVSRGATIGRCCENNKDEEFALMGSVILMKRKEIITSCYLVNWLKNDDIRPLIYTTSAASAQQAIYMKDLSTKKIMLPPMDLQNQFSEFVEQVDKSKFLGWVIKYNVVKNPCEFKP